MQQSLKLRGTNYLFKWANIPGTPLTERPADTNLQCEGFQRPTHSRGIHQSVCYNWWISFTNTSDSSFIAEKLLKATIR